MVLLRGLRAVRPLLRALYAALRQASTGFLRRNFSLRRLVWSFGRSGANLIGGRRACGGSPQARNGRRELAERHPKLGKLRASLTAPGGSLGGFVRILDR